MFRHVRAFRYAAYFDVTFTDCFNAISPNSRRFSNFSSFHLFRDYLLHPLGFNGDETIDRQGITSSPSRARGAGDTWSVSHNSGGGYPVIGYRRRWRRFRGCPTWRTFCPSRNRRGNAGGFQRGSPLWHTTLPRKV